MHIYLKLPIKHELWMNGVIKSVLGDTFNECSPNIIRTQKIKNIINDTFGK